MKLENKEGYQDTEEIRSNVGCYGDTMSFGEIAEVMGLTESQVKKIYERAMRKLKSPEFARLIWEYERIGDTPHINDMAGNTH